MAWHNVSASSKKKTSPVSTDKEGLTVVWVKYQKLSGWRGHSHCGVTCSGVSKLQGKRELRGEGGSKDGRLVTHGGIYQIRKYIKDNKVFHC